MKLLLILQLILFSTCVFGKDFYRADEAYEKEKEINTLIDKSNSCKIDSDCIVVDFMCPFGCGSAINKNKRELLEKVVTEFHMRSRMWCMYECDPINKAKCVNNKCVGFYSSTKDNHRDFQKSYR